MQKYFYTLPVYSMNKELYEKKLNIFLDNEVKKYNYYPETHDGLLRLIKRNYYRSWEFNQIIGYLKLFRSGDKINADFWKINKKRIALKLDKKYFELFAWYPEWNINLKELKSSKDIYEKLLQEIPKELTGLLEKYFIDLTMFKTIGPFINWFDLLNIYENNTITHSNHI